MQIFYPLKGFSSRIIRSAYRSKNVVFPPIFPSQRHIINKIEIFPVYMLNGGMPIFYPLKGFSSTIIRLASRYKDVVRIFAPCCLAKKSL